MIPVSQSIFSSPGGDCFPACIASIFEIPLRAVPHFFEESAGKHMWTQEQWDAVRAFADLHDTTAHWIDPETEPEEALKLEESGLFYIATGTSPHSSLGHCVVMQSGRYVHDPFDGKYLSGNPWLYVVFLPTEPGERRVKL